MSEISAATVMKLRKMSGQGMMDCKKALQETDGDLDAAMQLLRKKGLATMEKRSGRDTTEGIVVSNISDDGKTAAMATLCCETDFVSRNDDFIALAEKLADCTLTCEGDQGAEAICNTQVDGKTFAEAITDVVSKTGEKTEVGDFTRYHIEGSGVFGSYVHFNNKIGTLVEIETENDDVSCGLATIATDIAMHITAINPDTVDRDSIDAEVVEKEKAKAAEQITNKPPEIVEKIIEGKLGKFFSEYCLVDQSFVKDDGKTVGQALADAAKAAGGQAKIKRFIRFEIG